MASVGSQSDSTTILQAAENYDLLEIISQAIAYTIIIAGVLSVAYIFYGGISFILSGGQEEKIKSAVSTIRYAIFGLFVTIFATIIIGGIGRIFLGLDIIQYIQFGDVIERVRSITAPRGSQSLD